MPENPALPSDTARPADTVRIDVVQLDADLPMPAYARAGDAGADLPSRVEAVVPAGGARVLIPTGIRVAIPLGYAGFVLPRSGLALRHGITLANSPGLVDAGYRDELKVIVINTDPTEPFVIHRGDRIAQLVIQAVVHAEFARADDLADSARGGGFGHTGGFGHAGR